MAYNPSRYHCPSLRLPDYDYSQNGTYFVTLNVLHRTCVLGSIDNGVVCLSDLGQIVTESWMWLAEQYSYVTLGAWVVMSDHLHAIIQIGEYTGNRKPLGQLIGAFKTVSTKQINTKLCTPGGPFGQRNFYEQVIRDEAVHHAISLYIAENPRQWNA